MLDVPSLPPPGFAVLDYVQPLLDENFHVGQLRNHLTAWQKLCDTSIPEDAKVLQIITQGASIEWISDVRPPPRNFPNIPNCFDHENFVDEQISTWWTQQVVEVGPVTNISPLGVVVTPKKETPNS